MIMIVAAVLTEVAIQATMTETARRLTNAFFLPESLAPSFLASFPSPHSLWSIVVLFLSSLPFILSSVPTSGHNRTTEGARERESSIHPFKKSAPWYYMYSYT